MKRFSFQELKTVVKSRFLNCGINEQDADILGEYFATVDFYGVESHGVRTLDAHIKRIQRGGYNIYPQFKIKKETPAFAVIDGDNSIGMLNAIHCIHLAVERAAKSGIFTVLSFNNNTYGSAFYYALKAAEKGYICMTSSNSPAQMAPIGGKEKLLGTNPFAIAIPADKNPPIIIDMATSAVAKSKLNEYRANGQPIPAGWALDCEGNPTTDVEKAMSGLMLPMAGFKGYGISMMIDILSGVLSGSAYLNNVGRFYNPDNTAMNVGFSFTLIDPRMIFGKEFYTEMDKYIDTVRGSIPVDGNTVLLPGDDRLTCYRENMEKGCLLSEIF